MRLWRAPIESGVRPPLLRLPAPLERTAASAVVCAPISDEESYPYRIGTVHTCRDAAYADAGVHLGAFLRTLSVVNFPGAALDV